MRRERDLNPRPLCRRQACQPDGFQACADGRLRPSELGDPGTCAPGARILVRTQLFDACREAVRMTA